jgi:small subunit ribosomal protein S17
MAQTRNQRRQMQGVVTSAKTPKTITVEVERTFKHLRYGKYIRSQKRYLAHDEERAAREGDVVEIVSTRPLSKRKRWRLLRVVSRSQFGALEWTDPTAGALESLTSQEKPQ